MLNAYRYYFEVCSPLKIEKIKKAQNFCSIITSKYNMSTTVSPTWVFFFYVIVKILRNFDVMKTNYRFRISDPIITMVDQFQTKYIFGVNQWIQWKTFSWSTKLVVKCLKMLITLGIQYPEILKKARNRVIQLTKSDIHLPIGFIMRLFNICAFSRDFCI